MPAPAKHLGDMWTKIGVLNCRQAEAGFVPGARSAFNKVAHRLTGWETVGAASGINGDKGEMLPRSGDYQQVGG